MIRTTLGHRQNPRFWAQPPLILVEPFNLCVFLGICDGDSKTSLSNVIYAVGY